MEHGKRVPTGALCAVVVLCLATGPTPTRAGEVMLRLELAVCERLVPDFPIDRLTTGRVTVDGQSQARRWPTVPIMLPSTMAERSDLMAGGMSGDPPTISAALVDGEVDINGVPPTEASQAFLGDLCRQLADWPSQG